MSRQEARSFDSEPLTANGGYSERCENPLCLSEMEPGRGKKWCSDRCKMEGYVLRRAKEIVDRVGIIKFNVIMERLNDGP